MTTKHQQFDIHNEFVGLIRKNRYSPKAMIRHLSMYIPSVNVRYTNAAIWHVFERLIGVVTRIDTVSIKTPEGTSTNFKSVFVFFSTASKRIFEEQIRINPNVNTEFMNRHFWQSNARIRNTEYWMLLPNMSVVSNTTLSLDQIATKMTILESIVSGEELDALNANRAFLVELRDKQTGNIPPYADTSINVHQLARNIELMEERTFKAKVEVKVEAEIEEKIEAPKTFKLEEWQRDFVKENAMILITDIPELSFEPELWDYFHKYGNIEFVKVCKHPKTKKSLGYGYVCFVNAETAASVVAEEHEQFSVVIAEVE